MTRPAQGDLNINGTVSPGFEPVRKLFEKQMSSLHERNAQLCIYVGGEKVVDLWGTAVADESFTADTLVNIFSSGKSLEAIALAALASEGLIDYQAKIADYWPEFGVNGKESLTVADLMRHEAGLAALNVSIEPEDFLPGNIKENKIGGIIENHPAKFRQGPDNQREYHAITRGWIANELFRRVDPRGRTIGEFFREELSADLEADVHIGVQETDLHRRSPVIPLSLGAHLLETLKPAFMGRRVKHNIFQLAGNLLPVIPGVRKGTTRDAPPPYVGMESVDFFNEPGVAMGETPSANTHASARGLAKIASMMAMGGVWQGKQYINDEAWQAMHADPIARKMLGESIFTQGGVALFSEPEPGATPMEIAANRGRDGFYGWMGLGGSIFQWNPEKKIGFAYVPTALHVLDLFNERGKAHQQEVLNCVG